MNDLFDRRPRRNLDGGRVIAIRGAREHNLKNVDLEIPRDRLVVFTGLSGSGKSSLAFDTIYAEGQRRYVESLSAYARQFLEMMQKPDVDQIDGLSPAISIEQKTTSKNPRSTVGTVTEIYDYMRLLWARIGIAYSPATGLPIESQTVSQMVDRVLALPEGTRLYLLAPVVRGRKGEYRKELADFLKKGFQRVKIDGDLSRNRGRAGARQEIQPRHRRRGGPHRGAPGHRPAPGRKFRDLAQTRRRHRGRGIRRSAGRSRRAGPASNTFRREKSRKNSRPQRPAAASCSRKNSPARCPASPFPEIEPRLFSFNNPFGACPACGGLGLEQKIDADLVIPDHSATLRKGAIAPWSRSTSPYYVQTLEALARHYKFTLDTKWKDLPRKVQDAILYGSGEDAIRFVYDDGLRAYETNKPFEGVITNLERRFRETESEWAREELTKYFTDIPCSACNGPPPQARSAGGQGRRPRHRRRRRDERQARRRMVRDRCRASSAPSTTRSPARVLKEIRERLKFLVDVGLEYLTLARASRHAVGRREPAHPPRLADRLRPHRRALCARRALDRPAPARQCAAAGNPQAAARSRQHRDRGRA